MGERPMSMEIPGATPPGESAPERKERSEAEPVRRSFEYRDTEGGLLGVAEVTLGADAVEMPYAAVKEGEKAQGRRLLSFVLRGEKDGKPVEMDMLGLANRHGVEVLSSDARLVNYEYSDEKKRAIVPPLETPLDVGVFLHELGHADQFHDDRFGKIAPLYAGSRQATAADISLSYGSVRKFIDAVVDAVPEAAIALDHESMRQLEILEGRRQTAFDAKASREGQLDERERLRNEALGGLLAEAMRSRADLDAIVSRCDEIATSEGDAPPPLRASSAVRKLVEEMKKAGIMFLEQAADGIPEEAEGSAAGGRIAAERPERQPLLSEAAVTSARQARELLKQMMQEPDAAEVDLRFDGRKEELTVLATLRLPGLRRNIIGRFPLEREAFARYARERDADDRQVRHFEALADDAYKDVTDYGHAQELLMQSLDLKAIAGLPTKMMERDATRRALQWLREARGRTGADLLKTHAVPPEALVAVGTRPPVPEGCVGSTADGMGGGADADVEASVLDDLKRALATYDADKLRLRPPDDESAIGITPVAGMDRTKKPPKH